MGQSEQRVADIEEHVADLTSNAAAPEEVDLATVLPGTEDVEAELRRLRSELLGLRTTTASGFAELRARLDQLEQASQ